MTFDDLDLDPVFLKAVAALGYEVPTPIQQQAIPAALDGEDIVAVAQTGTGKTAAFALPTLQWLLENPVEGRGPRPIRCLVLSPTRELASQIGADFTAYGKGTDLVAEVIFGGVDQRKQVRKLKAGMDVLVATPGRLLDLMGQGHVHLEDIEVLVLDEADRMLDMGFIHDVTKVLEKLPEDKQTLLFSATMPQAITKLARRFLHEPVRVEVTPPATTVEKISQSLFHVDKPNKRKLLLHLLEDPEVRRVLVFSRTKHGANAIARTLDKVGIGAAAIHGNKSQGARERALAAFKNGSQRVLVATDIAARGIDVEGITHVIQLDLPNVPEQYVHRIGRTARAGTEGVAWAFCSFDERDLLRDIEKTIGQKIDVVDGHPFPATGEGAGESQQRNQQNRTRHRNQHAHPPAHPKKKSGNRRRRGGRRAGGQRS
jgi:ATP-dependent RNA helicase RhlE